MLAPVSTCVHNVELSKGHDTFSVKKREHGVFRQQDAFVKSRMPRAVEKFCSTLPEAKLTCANSPTIRFNSLLDGKYSVVFVSIKSRGTVTRLEPPHGSLIMPCCKPAIPGGRGFALDGIGVPSSG